MIKSIVDLGKSLCLRVARRASRRPPRWTTSPAWAAISRKGTSFPSRCRGVKRRRGLPRRKADRSASRRSGPVALTRLRLQPSIGGAAADPELARRRSHIAVAGQALIASSMACCSIALSAENTPPRCSAA